MKKFLTIFNCIALLPIFFSNYAMENPHQLVKKLENNILKQQFVMKVLPKIVPSGESLEEYTIVLKKEMHEIGQLMFTYYPQSFEGCIEELNVKASYRKNGFGTDLMQKALAMLQEFDCKKVWLLASPERKNDLLKLIAFYEKFGFHVDEDGIKNSCNLHEAGMEMMLQSPNNK